MRCVRLFVSSKTDEMIRDVTRLMLAAWMAAVLTVSPLLAALECRQCCGANDAASVAKDACEHRAEPATPLCCQGKSEPSREQPGRCDHCPKCELKRPLTATVSGSFDWKLPTDFVTAILPRPTDGIAVIAQAFGSARVEAVDLGTPPPRILFCVRQE